MFRIINRLILFLLFATAVTVVFLISGVFSDETASKRYTTEAKTHSVLIGRFLEHIVDERREHLEIAASITSRPIRYRSLTEYTKFIREHYDMQGGFAVGEVDKNFKSVTLLNHTSASFNPREIINGDIRQKLSSGSGFVGIIPGRNNLPGELIIVAYPLLDENGFNGAVYDVFAFNDEKVQSSLWQNTLSGSRVYLLTDGKPVSRDSEEPLRLYRLKNGGSVVKDGAKMVGFYTFTVLNTEFTLIYQTAGIKNILNLSCCPSLEPYSDLILLSPLILLFIFAILELARLNRNLESQVQERTKHINILKNRYESLFQTIPEYVAMYKTDGTVIEHNKKCAEILPDDKNANIYSVIKDSYRFRQKVESLNSGIVDRMGEFVIITPKGATINVSVSSAIVNTEDGKAVISAFTDLTEYKDIQNSFYLAQRREAVGTLAAGMAHDFGNILQNISLQYNLAERSDDAEKREKYLNSINNIVEGARKYLDGVLKSTKSSETPAEPKPGGMITRSAIEITGHILPAEVKIDFRDESDGMKIKINESRYIQLIVNLCQNASEAMNKKGTVYVTVSAEEKQFGTFFSLRVRDTGKGIEQSEIKNIFKPFYTTKSGKGTGLGLATVKQVVMDSGGLIDVKSTQGDGCEFIILIPESK